MKLKNIIEKRKNNKDFNEGWEAGREHWKHMVSVHPLESFIEILNQNDISYQFYETEITDEEYMKRIVTVKIKVGDDKVNGYKGFHCLFNFTQYDNVQDNSTLTKISIHE